MEYIIQTERKYDRLVLKSIYLERLGYNKLACVKAVRNSVTESECQMRLSIASYLSAYQASDNNRFDARLTRKVASRQRRSHQLCYFELSTKDIKHKQGIATLSIVLLSISYSSLIMLGLSYATTDISSSFHSLSTKWTISDNLCNLKTKYRGRRSRSERAES